MRINLRKTAQASKKLLWSLEENLKVWPKEQNALFLAEK